MFGEMIQFDGCIFFRWVGEKPPTSRWFCDFSLVFSASGGVASRKDGTNKPLCFVCFFLLWEGLWWRKNWDTNKVTAVIATLGDIHMSFC